ncbi:MAG: HDOD domain-containing protein [Verrucomicrobiota bacterium]
MPVIDRPKILVHAEEMPPTPQILCKIQSCMQDPNADLQDLVKLIRMDATLAAQIVRLSNSSYYGCAIPSENVMEAVQRLGFREVHRLVGLVASKQLFGAAAPVYRMKAGELWDQSISRAIAMDTYAKIVGVNNDTAYTIGLLHGIGKIIVNKCTLESGLSFYDEDEDAEPITPEFEKRILGFHFAEVGGILLESWKFTQEVILPVKFQIAPQEAPDQRVMTSLLYLANHVMDQWRFGQEIDLSNVPDLEEVLEIAGLKSEQLIEAMDPINEAVGKVREEFN